MTEVCYGSISIYSYCYEMATMNEGMKEGKAVGDGHEHNIALPKGNQDLLLV